MACASQGEPACRVMPVALHLLAVLMEDDLVGAYSALCLVAADLERDTRCIKSNELRPCVATLGHARCSLCAGGNAANSLWHGLFH